MTLHSYRYAWAERALKCGYPERFAQQALGHNSKAVHHAYSKHAEVTVPSLDDWEREWGRRTEDRGPRAESEPSGVAAHATGQGMPEVKVLPVDFGLQQVGPPVGEADSLRIASAQSN